MGEEEKVTSVYFDMIYDRLSSIQSVSPWADEVLGQLQLLKMDVMFLKEFCQYPESWDYTTDEESRERLGSMITTLTVIWPKELESWGQTPMGMSIQDFHSASLEAKIQQTKQHVEGWCEYLMDSSMQCQPLTFSDIRCSLESLRMNLDDFSSYRADKNVPLKKQIDLLKAKIVFLEESLNTVDCCQDGEEIPQFLDFIGDFAKRAACLACLYWAKEDNEETATEMCIHLFNMLQKFISSAYNIIPLYHGILKSYNLQPSDSFLFEEAVERFIDFFFEHLAITLMDDFFILRDHLIFLFVFLTNPSSENAAMEGSIRSQIFALLHEDAYLPLPFDVMKEDFSDKKVLLSDCMIKIDITVAQIRQLYCEFSDS